MLTLERSGCLLTMKLPMIDEIILAPADEWTLFASIFVPFQRAINIRIFFFFLILLPWIFLLIRNSGAWISRGMSLSSLLQMQPDMLVQQSHCTDIIRTVLALESVARLELVIRLVNLQQPRFVGSVRTHIASEVFSSTRS